jgi:chemotaxis protein CheD
MEKDSHKTVFLHSSSIFADRVPTQVTTILGSCVSVCLWDSKLRIGGMNHFMLSLWNGDGLASPKFGNIAISKLIEKMTKLGSEQKHLQAKIFGGADLFEGFSRDGLSIGGMNIKIAEEILKQEKIPIVNFSVGGKQGRKIIFDTSTGEVLMKYIRKGLISNPSES